MNSGVGLLALGVLAAVAGAAMYLLGWHHTVGLSGIVLGVILVVLGLVSARKKPTASMQAPTTTGPS
jgi:hypothetical protein